MINPKLFKKLSGRELEKTAYIFFVFGQEHIGSDLFILHMIEETYIYEFCFYFNSFYFNKHMTNQLFCTGIH